MKRNFINFDPAPRTIKRPVFSDFELAFGISIKCRLDETYWLYMTLPTQRRLPSARCCWPVLSTATRSGTRQLPEYISDMNGSWKPCREVHYTKYFKAVSRSWCIDELKRERRVSNEAPCSHARLAAWIVSSYSTGMERSIWRSELTCKYDHNHYLNYIHRIACTW